MRNTYLFPPHALMMVLRALAIGTDR